MKQSIWITNIISFLFLVLMVFLSQNYMSRHIKSLEKEIGLKEIKRAKNFILLRPTRISASAVDWGHWDDTYQFVQDRNQDFLDANFIEAATLKNLNLSVMIFLNEKKEPIYIRARNNDNDEFAVDIDDNIRQQVKSLEELTDLEDIEASKGGLYSFNGQVYMMSAAHIIKSNAKGPSKGYVIAGLIAGNQFFDEMGNVLGNKYELQVEEDEIIDSVQFVNQEQVIKSFSLKVCCNDRNLVVRFITERSLNTLLKSNLQKSLILYSILLFFFIIIINLLMLSLQKKQEIMLEQSKTLENNNRLSKLNTKVLNSSHLAGMAQIARSVVHLVGNTLNTIIVSSSNIKKDVQSSKIETLFKMSDKLQANKDNLKEFLESNDGQTLIKLLPVIAHDIQSKLDSISIEINKIEQNGRHIQDVVHTQEQYAKLSDDNFESVSLAEIINDSIDLQGDLLNNCKIALDIDDTKCYCQRTKLMHIITNLILNAKRAMDANDGVENILTFKCHSDDKFIFLEVSDNGIGIDTEKIKEIFNTDSSGLDKTAFGLHSSANSMTEMGGEISAESEGKGKGTKFILKFPNHH